MRILKLGFFFVIMTLALFACQRAESATNVASDPITRELGAPCDCMTRSQANAIAALLCLSDGEELCQKIVAGTIECEKVPGSNHIKIKVVNFPASGLDPNCPAVAGCPTYNWTFVQNFAGWSWTCNP